VNPADQSTLEEQTIVTRDGGYRIRLQLSIRGVDTCPVMLTSGHY